MGELQPPEFDLYLHEQALDTSTPSGRMLFGMLSVFNEFERAMIHDRVIADLGRAGSSGTTPFTVQRICLPRDEVRGVREVARLAAEEPVAPALIRYLNRLSGHLFVLVRALNDIDADDIPWVPGGNLGQSQ